MSKSYYDTDFTRMQDFATLPVRRVCAGSGVCICPVAGADQKTPGARRRRNHAGCP